VEPVQGFGFGVRFGYFLRGFGIVYRRRVVDAALFGVFG
jgi:hypothetical protein